ncbi:MAG TPA: AI-2E family transporter [Actinomycetota bacterium]
MARRGRAARIGEEGDRADQPVDQSRGVAVSNLRMSPGLARLVRYGVGAWALIGILILGFLVWRYVLSPVGILFAPIILAVVFVYLLNPIVARLESGGISRGLGTLITYVVILGVLGVALRYLVPALAQQVSAFAKAAPELLRKLDSAGNHLNRRFHLHLDVAQAVRSLEPSASGGKFISRLFSFTVGVLHGLFALAVGLLVAFYLLLDLPKLRRAASAAVPPRHAEEVRSVMVDIGQAVGGYFRGQLVVSLIAGLGSTAVLYLVGLPYWALVGGLAGLFNLIPLIGPFLAAGVALFVAFTTLSSGGLMHLTPGFPLAIGAIIALQIVHIPATYILAPNIIGRTVSLHPVTVMLGLLAAGSMFGLPGMLLSVPVLGSAKVVILHWWDRRRWPPDAGPATGSGGERTVLKDASQKETPGEVPA